MKNTKHSVVVKVPINHRMGPNKAILPDGKINKYKLANKVANQIHRNSVNGGGYGGGNDYEVSVSMPASKMDIFKKALRENKLRFHDYGPEED